MKVMKDANKSYLLGAHTDHIPAELSDLPQLHEIDYLRRVLTADPTHPGFQHVSHLLEDFRIEGPNGRHLCLVTDLLGEGLDKYCRQFPNRQVPIAIVKSIFRQVAMALMYLHDKCNIIHTDVKNNNILLTLPDGGTISSPLPTDVKVKLIDFGPAGLTTPPPADVWALGCLVYELATGEFILSESVDEMSMPYMHALIFGGPYPLALIKRGKFSSYFFKPDGSPLFDIEGEAPLAEIIRRRYKGPDPEGLIQFLQTIFRLDPEERPTLQTLLEHPWLSALVV
ncbi:kinase-like domain-containing protein [Roridomyces roridus]|uniref:non-specific serine/threonine protein kinase n=1 Tax=Roridomyces roridus TaxID=1738132 RepID=A0AAD7FFF4_9AGAR|nr:kinase-like domain-containing protein [Roridomyces roridus]